MEDLLQLREKIEDADMILLGIGEELSLRYAEVLKENPIYIKFQQEIEALAEAEQAFVRESLVRKELESAKQPQIRELLKAYQQLKELVDGKNLFVVTTCNDDVIDKAGFPLERVVKPCGTGKLLQCADGCTETVTDAGDCYEAIGDALEEMYLSGVFWPQEIQCRIPRCPECQSYMRPNLVGIQGYSEQGYLPQWKRYTMWLQGTLNKKLCLLELGENFRYPTVIRWPFEKVANLNQKSVMVRVNKALPQVTKEIAERSFSVAADSKEFLEKIAAIPKDEQIQ